MLDECGNLNLNLQLYLLCFEIKLSYFLRPSWQAVFDFCDYFVDNLCTKQGNSSIKSAGSNGPCTVNEKNSLSVWTKHTICNDETSQVIMWKLNEFQKV